MSTRNVLHLETSTEAIVVLHVPRCKQDHVLDYLSNSHIFYQM